MNNEQLKKPNSPIHSFTHSIIQLFNYSPIQLLEYETKKIH
jgi:hypothetical protein